MIGKEWSIQRAIGLVRLRKLAQRQHSMQ